MPAIPTQFRQVVSVTTGGQKDLAVNPNLSHHSIAVQGTGTGQFTVQVKPAGLTTWRAFDDNTIAEGKLAVFALGALEGIRLIPTTAGVAYTVSLSSY